MESSRSRSVSRCGRTRSSSSNYLPDELIFKILSWTCVISLLRCRSVCKSWLSIISKPEFIKAHLTNFLSKLPSILIFTSKIDDEDYLKEQGFELVERVYGRRAATIVYSNSPEEEDSLNLPLMPPFDGNVEFISSCNGIVCVSVRDRMSVRDIYLFNPLTRRRRMFTKLPPPPIFRIANHNQHCFTEDVVFGFDCLSHDFKVLKIAYATTADDHRKITNVVAAHLYSLNDDSWRVIEVGIKLPSFLCYPYCPILRSGPVLDGVLYLEGMDVIITFNLHNESFGLIKYPSFMHTRKSSVLDFEASVALVIESVRDGTLDEKEVSLWTMEAVSDEVFWNKMLTFGAGSEEIDWVFLYCGADKFVGRTKLGTVVMYDYRKKETKIIGLPSQSFLVRVLKHTENFLSPEEFKNVEGR